VAGLRQRRHAETSDGIVSVALELFAEQGFGQVTMEDIARAAGVSRRTVYRRFPSKEHLVLHIPKRWLAAWDAAVAGLPDAPPIVVAEAACLAVARYIDAHKFEVLTAYAALAESPALATAGASNEAWIERVVTLLRRESTPPTAGTSYVIAGAYMGAIDAMMAYWVGAGGRGSVLRQTRALLDRLRPIWPSA
jgi:AcrR family transcriptional regulator